MNRPCISREIKEIAPPSSFFSLYSSALDLIRTFFIWNELDIISTFSIWNGLDFISTFFIWNGLDLTSSFFIRDGLDLTRLALFSLEIGFTLLSDCSFKIGLDSSDFSFLFQAQETKGGTRCIARLHEVYAARGVLLPCIALVFDSDH